METRSKPPELLALHFVTEELFRILKSWFDVPDSVTLNTAPGSIGCSYYEAMLRELLKLMIGSVGSVDHVRCAGRGEGTCEWRADWKTFDATA